MSGPAVIRPVPAGRGPDVPVTARSRPESRTRGPGIGRRRLRFPARGFRRGSARQPDQRSPGRIGASAGRPGRGMSLQVLRRSPRGPLDPGAYPAGDGKPERALRHRRRASPPVPGPSGARSTRAVAADTGRADSPPRAGAAPWRGSSPARQAPAAHPRAEEARARADARVSAAPDFASAVAGYRAWQLGAGGVLFPLALPAAPPWEPAVNRARYFAGRRHDSTRRPRPTARAGCMRSTTPTMGGSSSDTRPWG